MGRLDKKTIGFIAACLFLVVGYFSFLFLAFFPQKPKIVKKPPVTASSIEANYSRINMLTPGKSTRKDVVFINGKPVEEVEKNGGNYLFYDTPTSGLKNKVFIVNDIVVYAIEYVFGNYRGNLDNYTKDYGKPSFVLYQDVQPWHVFLKQGLMIQSANNFITAIVYFVPLSEDEFFKKIAPEFDLSKNNLEINQGEAIPTPEP